MDVTVKITSPQEGEFKAECPTMPGCQAKGRSLDEAKENIRQAIIGYVASLGAVPPENVNEHLVAA